MMVVIGAVVTGAAVAGATGPMGEEPAKSDKQLNIPHTPEEHLARADHYKKKAAEYRAEAEMHRKMFADYHAKNPDKPLYTGEGLEIPHGEELASVTKMRKHCDEYIQKAEALAAEADRFADFHRMRAEEMRGK
jgi:hypothetical protein